MFYGKGNSEWKICGSIPQGTLSNDGGRASPIITDVCGKFPRPENLCRKMLNEDGRA